MVVARPESQEGPLPVPRAEGTLAKTEGREGLYQTRESRGFLPYLERQECPCQT